MLGSAPHRIIGFLRLHAVASCAVLLIVGMWITGGWSERGSSMTRVAVLMAGFAGFVLAVRHYRRLTRDLDRMTDAVRHVAAEQSEHPYLSAEGDLHPLSDAMNQMFQGISLRQQQLQEMADRLGTVLSAMVEGVLAVDDRQRILFANAAAGKLLGFDPERARGKGLLEVARNHMLHEAVSETLANRDLPNQETRWYELNSHPSRGQILSFRATRLLGEPCPGVVLVLQDVTELRRLEHLRQEFVANVSHELKTPLTAIKAYAETLQSGAIDDPKINREFTANIEREADRLNNLIVDLLRLAKIESGHEPFEILSVDLADTIRDCVHRHQLDAQRKQLTLIAEEGDDGCHVQADQDGLRAILDNLVDNALKYTEPGGRVNVRWTDSENGTINMLVSDTGIGIPYEHQSRVFERFFRVDQARSRELGSTGLGLAIVKHLAHAFGGTVVVCSQPDVGTTVRVLLPRTGP
jgi:two-component system phosphate regulon sensor histidine kinase PhoR